MLFGISKIKRQACYSFATFRFPFRLAFRFAFLGRLAIGHSPLLFEPPSLSAQPLAAVLFENGLAPLRESILASLIQPVGWQILRVYRQFFVRCHAATSSNFGARW